MRLGRGSGEREDRCAVWGLMMGCAVGENEVRARGRIGRGRRERDDEDGRGEERSGCSVACWGFSTGCILGVEYAIFTAQSSSNEVPWNQRDIRALLFDSTRSKPILGHFGNDDKRLYAGQGGPTTSDDDGRTIESKMVTATP